MATIEQAVAGGISFALTDEQKALRELARDFATNEIRPKAAEYDEHQTHPADIVEKAHDLGLMNVHVPEEYGGLGLPCFDGMLIGEELYWGCAGIGTSIAANGLGAGPVLVAGSDEQKRTWLPPLLDEPILCSFGLTEPGAGSDVDAMKTTAVRSGDEYVLNGSKTFITNAVHAAWPAFVMNVFEPLRTYSSPLRTAVVFIAATSEPAPGSVRPKEQRIGSSRSGGSQVRFCSSVPARITGPAPSPLHESDVPIPEQPQFSSSATSTPSSRPSSGPPYSIGTCRFISPTACAFATTSAGW